MEQKADIIKALPQIVSPSPQVFLPTQYPPYRGDTSIDFSPSTSPGGFRGGEAPFFIKGRRVGKDIKQR
jgi:hypothetical protein